MNEQALKDAYELFKSGGYNGSIEDFTGLIASNPNALKDSYNLFKGGGYTGSLEDYSTLIGLKKKVEGEAPEGEVPEGGEPLDVDGGTSDVEDGGLASSEIEQPTPTTPQYQLFHKNGGATPITRNRILTSITDEDFLLSLSTKELSLSITNDDPLQEMVNSAIAGYEKKISEEEPEISPSNESDRINYSKAVNEETLVPLSKENDRISLNPTLSKNLVNPIVNDALRELNEVWLENPGLNVESTYRDEELNTSVGGDVNSYHLHGLAIDLTGPNAKKFLEWVNTTKEGKAWAEKWTEGAAGGLGVILEDEAGKGEHVHIQFKRGLSTVANQATVLPSDGYSSVSRSNDGLGEYVDGMWVPSATSPVVDIGFDDDDRLSWLDRSGIDLGDGEDEEEVVEGDVFDQDSSFETWWDETFGPKEGRHHRNTLNDIRHLLTEQEIQDLNNIIETSKWQKGFWGFMKHPFRWLGVTNKELQEEGFAGFNETQVARAFIYDKIMDKVQAHIEGYLASGWEHLGNQVYKHTESGVVISPENTQGRHPLLAYSSALPTLIERIHKNPDYLNVFELKEGVENGDLLADKIMEIYKEFNPEMHEYYTQQIGTMREVWETEVGDYHLMIDANGEITDMSVKVGKKKKRYKVIKKDSKEFNKIAHQYHSNRDEYPLRYSTDMIGQKQNEYGEVSYATDEEGEGFERKKVLEGELKERATGFVLNSLMPILDSNEKNMSNSGVNQKTAALGAQLSAGLDWLEKQESLIRDFPRHATGQVDTRNMSNSDIERYNQLITDYNAFFNGRWQELLKEHEIFKKENSEVPEHSTLIDSFNNVAAYYQSLDDGEDDYARYVKAIRAKQNQANKSFEEATWVGKQIRQGAVITNDLFNTFVRNVAASPRWIKGVFTDENIYDGADMLADNITANLDANTYFNAMNPSWSLKASQLNTEAWGKYWYTDVEGKRLTFNKQGQVTNIFGDDGRIIQPGSDEYKEIISEYNSNQDKYPIQYDKRWGSVLYNTVHAGGGFAIDMTIGRLAMGRAKVLGYGQRGQRYAFMGGLSGATHLRVYDDFYREGLDQGMLPGEATDFASQASFVTSLVEIITPDVGMISASVRGGVKKQLRDKMMDNIQGRVTTSAVNRAYRKKVLGNVAYYGTMEGLEEVGQHYGVDQIKDKYYGEFNFNTNWDWDVAKEEFVIGALLGGGTTAVSTYTSGKDHIMGGLYKEAWFNAYLNQQGYYDALDGMLGKTMMINGLEVEMTQAKIDKLKTEGKSKFEALNKILKSNNATNLSESSKMEIMHLLEMKGYAEAFQGSLDANEKSEAELMIKETESAIQKILTGQDVGDALYTYYENLDGGVKEYLGKYMKGRDVPFGVKALIRKIVKGESLTESEKAAYLSSINQDITELDAKENLTKEEKNYLSILKKLENDVTNLTTKKDETTTTRDTGKAERTARGAKGKSIREAIEDAANEQDRTTLNQNIGKPVSYKGKKGILEKNKKGEFILKTPGKGRGIKIKDAGTGRKRLSTVGLKYEGKTLSVTPNNELIVEGDNKGEILGLSKDTSGKLGGVVMLDNEQNESIKKKARAKFRRLQKQRNEGKITQQQFIDGINNTAGLSIESNNEIRAKSAADFLVNSIINTGKADVISMKDVEKMIKEATEESGVEEQKKKEETSRKKSTTSKRNKRKKIKEQKVSPDPLWDSREMTIEDIDALIAKYDKYAGDVYKRKVAVLKIVKKLYNSLGFDVTVHMDRAQLESYFSSIGQPVVTTSRGISFEAGLEGATPQMHINLDIANPNTMFHESAHPFVTSLHKLAETNPEVKKLLANIKKDLGKIKDGYYIKWAKKGYGVDKNGFPTDNEADIVNMDKVMQEALSEFLADVGLQKYEDDQSILGKAKSYIKSIVKYLFGKDIGTPPLELTLEDLSNLTDLEGVQKVFTQATSRGLNINEKSEGTNPIEAKYQLAPPENSSEFEEWFGNSKIVDKNGNPVVYYHRTKNEFDTFRGNVMTGAQLTAYVSPSESWANEFMDIIESETLRKDRYTNLRTIPLYVKAENPFDFRNKEHTDMLFDAYVKEYAGDYELGGKEYTSQERIIPQPTLDDKVDKKTFFDSLQNNDNWALIESHEYLISQILGFDSMFISETNRRDDVELESAVNLAVFNPQQQLKSVDRTTDFDSPKYQYDINEQLEAHNTGGGSSFNNFFGKVEGAYAAVSIFNDRNKQIPGNKLNKSDLDSFRSENQFILDQHESIVVGTWYDEENNLIDLDVSVAIPKAKLDEAIKLGVEFNQKSIWDLELNKPIPTGGTGKVTTQDASNLQERIDKIKEIVGKLDPKYQRNIELEGKPGFSTLNNALKFSTMSHGTPKQWIKEIKKYGGKNIDNEMAFMGIKDFLESVETSYPGGIPKVAIEDYIEMHQTSMNFDGNTMSIMLGNETLGNLSYELKTNEDGEVVLFIKDIKSPADRMMSNLAPIIRHVIRFATEQNYDAIAFEDGSTFKGPKVEFFNSVVPEVISDILSSIDSKAGPVLTEVDGQGKVSMDITNSVLSNVLDVTLPSNDTKNNDNFNEEAKIAYSTDPKYQTYTTFNGIKDLFTNFNLKREFAPMGNIPKEVFDKGWRHKSRIKAEKFKLMKLIDRLRVAIQANQEGDNPVSIEAINEMLSDPSVKIQELESLIENYELDLETLDRDGKRYLAGDVLNKIRATEADIKELKEKAVGKAKMKDLDGDPELQKIIKQVRRKIDSFSRKIKTLVNDKLGITIDKNLGVYLNRQYRIHHDPKYNDKMIKVIDDMIKAGENPVKIAKVMNRFKKEYDLIQAASVVVREGLEKHYKGRDVSETAVLQDIRRMFQDGPESSDFVQAVRRSNDVNTGILKKRVDMPDAIMELFSPVKNPLFNIVSTITKQVSEMETMAFKAEAVAMLNGSLLFDKLSIPPGQESLYSEEVKLKYSDEVYYTTKEIKEFIDGEVYDPSLFLKSMQRINGAIKLGKTVWSFKTHARNFIGNMYFASINGHFNPRDLIESIRTMQNLYNNSTTQEREQMFTAMVENGIVDGVYADELADVLNDAQLSNMVEEFFDSGLDMESIKKRKPNLFKRINNWVSKTYLWEDVVWKGAGFISEIKLYEDAGFGRDEAIAKAADSVRNGYATYSLVPKLGKRLRRMILVGDFISFNAEVIRTGIGSLIQAQKMITSGNRVLFQAGLKRIFGTIFAWTALPTMYTAMAGGIASAISMLKDWNDEDDEEMSNNDIMDHKLMNGEERRIDPNFMLYDSYSDWYNATHGADKFEDLGIPDMTRDEMIQLFLPHYMKYGDVKLVSANKDKNGNFDGTYYIWNSSDNLSQNYFTRILSAIFNPPEDDPTWKYPSRYIPQVNGILDDVLHAMMEPFLRQSMMVKILDESLSGETQEGKDLNEITDTGIERWVNSLKHALKEGQPGFSEQIYDMLESWHPDFFLDEDEMHRRKSPIHETMALGGFRFSRFNLAENLNFKTIFVANVLTRLNPEEDSPRRIRKEVKRHLTYLDKLWSYSEFLGIEENHVIVYDRENEPIYNTKTNRDNIVGKHIKGFNPGNAVYDFLHRDRSVFPTFDDWVKGRGDLDFADFLKDWQVEELEKQLIE